MGTVRIRPAVDAQESCQAAGDLHTARITRRLPWARVEHVGSTAVPGALTKGDVDLLVRVAAADFGPAMEVLRQDYSIHQPHNWTPTLASYRDPASIDPPVGVQLVVSGSADDALFVRFRDALIADSALLAEYNALKRRLDGEDYQRYTADKGEFVERALELIARGRV